MQLEVANILSGMSELGYRNLDLVNILHECLIGEEFKITGEFTSEYDLFTTYNILTSYARLAPDQTKYFTDFVPQLHTNLTEIYSIDKSHVQKNSSLIFTKIPDLLMYMNIWLSMATFAAMQPKYIEMTTMNQNFKLIIADLIKIFNQNERWNATEINLQEATNISVAIAVLKIQNEKFIGDIGDIIRMQVNDDAEP